ncbi:MAG: hypothetical protein QM765_06245 [Myxococcales bacterium]
MGLESIEFIVDLEKAFGLSIPDGDVAWRTGRELVNYLCRRIPEVDPGFGTPSARWGRTDVERIVEGLLAKNGRRTDVTLDTEIRSVFR